MSDASGIGPVVHQQPPVNVQAPAKPHGAALNARAAQSAAKTNATVKNILIWATVLCAGATCAFFFSAIFVSSYFVIPWAISLIATIALGLAGECTAPRKTAGQPAIATPYIPPPPPGTKPASKGLFGAIFAPEVPLPFVAGQPVQLTNDGSSCFIDATFQEITIWTEMKDALVESYTEWGARLTALSKLGVWLKTHDKAAQPTTEDIPLLIALFASGECGGYELIISRAEAVDAPESLTLFYEYIKAFRDARFKREDDPKIQAADIGKILPLFDYEPHWTPQNIDTFIQISKWLDQMERWVEDPKNNRVPTNLPKPDDLIGALMHSPECDARYKQIFENAKLTKPLIAFHAQVMLAKKEAAAPDTQQFFDLPCAAHFVRIAQDAAPTFEGIKGFLTAVETYEKTGAAREHRTGITLNALRKLLPAARRQGQQDATEWLLHLCNLIDVRKFPHLFFSLSIEHRYIPHDPAAPKDAPPAESHIKQLPPEPSYQLPIPVPNQPSKGQDLFDALFEFQAFKSPDIAQSEDPETGEMRSYKIDAERFHVDEFPDAFLLTLKRFGTDNKGRRVKNSQPVYMPEYLTRGGDTFEIMAIVQHNGNSLNGGHYIELSKKDGKWWECDDGKRYIRPASEATLKYGLTYGYQYLVRKCDKSAPLLQDWPPLK